MKNLKLNQSDLKSLHSICESWIRKNQNNQWRADSVDQIIDLKHKIGDLIEL